VLKVQVNSADSAHSAQFFLLHAERVKNSKQLLQESTSSERNRADCAECADPKGASVSFWGN